MLKFTDQYKLNAGPLFPKSWKIFWNRRTLWGENNSGRNTFPQDFGRTYFSDLRHGMSSFEFDLQISDFGSKTNFSKVREFVINIQADNNYMEFI